MKIGMMTFHKSQSHGAMLQAVALQKTLEKLGNDAEIINYNRFFIKSKNQVTNKSVAGKIKSFIIKIVSFAIKVLFGRKNRKKIQLFEDFREEYLNIGKKEYNTTAEMKNDCFDYDAFVTGSDQVWNPDTINHDAYYFTFLDETKNTVAYAPSIGVSEIKDQEIRDKMGEYLKHIKHLSCREESGAKVIESITGRHVEHVLDPTLLLTKEEWSSFVSEDTEHHKPYVLCYFLGSLKYGRDFAKKISKSLNYDLVFIPQSPVDFFRLNKKEFCVGPIEFLKLFKNASVICTDSFHGTAFSINMQKPFYSFCRRNPYGSASRLSRLKSLLSKLNLSERLIMPDDRFDPQKLEIDYETTNTLLNAEREKSLNYLKNALEDKPE